MPIFALPIAPSAAALNSQSHSSRVKFSNLSTRKRKRPVATSPENSSPEASDDEEDGTYAALIPASTNPLSLTPAEIAQYRLAGLRLEEEIPFVEAFPHRGLPRKYDLKPVNTAVSKKDVKGKGRDVHEDKEGAETEKEDGAREAKKGFDRGPQLRIQHLSVLTTILQRCLLEGDIERATRAWAMLLRGQFGGRGVDLRQSGYWGIGAELLMRSMDKPGKKPSYDSDSEDGDQEEVSRPRGGWGWGSREGLERAKDYYERLILQHPYKRHFHGSINALDFWPAMLGCEIYGVQAEQKDSLRKVQKEEDEDDGGYVSESQTEASEDEEEEAPLDGGFTADQRRKDQRTKRRAERRWVRRDDIRKTALNAAIQIAARLDELMGTPPFSDSHNLMRLRGMLALYIGDLSVPSMPIEDGIEPNDERDVRRIQRLGGENNGPRFLIQDRKMDHDNGRKTQAAEREKAQTLFRHIEKGGGSMEDIRYLSLVEGQEVDDDEE